jgi:type II secretory pathway pseudopilin PulG
MMSNRLPNRSGAASVVLSLMLLVIVTATALTTMRGQWARKKASDENESRRMLLAAIDAAQLLPEDLLSNGLRLPVNEKTNHWIVISMIQTERSLAVLQATEQCGDKAGLSMKRELKENGR